MKKKAFRVRLIKCLNKRAKCSYVYMHENISERRTSLRPKAWAAKDNLLQNCYLTNGISEYRFYSKFRCDYFFSELRIFFLRDASSNKLCLTEPFHREDWNRYSIIGAKLRYVGKISNLKCCIFLIKKKIKKMPFYYFFDFFIIEL